MSQYRRAAHTVYALHYHVVFTTKYRKPVLRGDVATTVFPAASAGASFHDAISSGKFHGMI